MAISTLKLALQPTAARGAPTYECPAGKTAIVKSCIAANTGEATSSQTVVLGVDRAGAFTALTGRIAVNSTSSVNLLAGTLSMEGGDKLVAYGSSDSVFQQSRALNLPGISTIGAWRARGTTLVIVFGNVIWRSTDAITWNVVYSGAPGSNGYSLLNIGTTWFNYISATSALRSTDDGVTWSSYTVSNGPGSGTSEIIQGHSGRYAYASNTSKITTSADGIAWTDSAATPAAVSRIVWTGTYYVAAATTGTNIYRSVDGASWATVSAVSNGNISGLANNGSTVIATATTGYFAVSTDSGATWSVIDITGIAYTAMFTGQVFMIFMGGAIYTSATGLIGTFETSSAALQNTYKFLVYDGRVITGQSYTLYESANLYLPRVGYGLSASASLMEVSA